MAENLEKSHNVKDKYYAIESMHKNNGIDTNVIDRSWCF